MFDISTQFVDRVIHNFVEEQKNWEEQTHIYLHAVPRQGYNMDVTGCNGGVTVMEQGVTGVTRVSKEGDGGEGKR